VIPHMTFLVCGVIALALTVPLHRPPPRPPLAPVVTARRPVLESGPEILAPVLIENVSDCVLTVSHYAFLFKDIP
jgi:hypothetical protein